MQSISYSFYFNFFKIVFLGILFLTFPEKTFSQNLETQYRQAVNSGNSNKAGKLAFQIGRDYYRQGNQKQAINYLTQAVKYSTNVKDYKNLGEVYSLRGLIYKNQRQYSLAILDYEKAAFVYDRLGSRRKIATSYYLGGLLYKDTKQYDKALYNFKEAAKIADRANATDLEKEARKKQTEIYKIKGVSVSERVEKKVQETEEYLEEAEVIDKKEQEIQEILKDSVNMTDSEFEKAMKKVAELEEQKKNLLAKAENALEDLEKERKDAEDLAKEKKDQEEKLIIIIASVAVVAFILIIFSIIQTNTVRAKKKANRELAALNQELASKNEEIESQKEIIEKEKERSEALLLNILPKQIAEELKHNPNLPPRSYDQVSVIFTDFKGFTQAAEQLTPEELIDELAECFSEFDAICERWNLERIKTIGDAYMCAGGIPSPNYTNPGDAVSAAMEMQEVIEQLKQKKMLQGKPYFEMRLGIHTGPVVAGVVGKKRFAYDIWGDTVNLAARMESSGEVGRVNISEYTYSLVRDAFFCTYRGKIEAKNKGEVDMYFVVSKF